MHALWLHALLVLHPCNHYEVDLLVRRALAYAPLEYTFVKRCECYSPGQFLALHQLNHEGAHASEHQHCTVPACMGQETCMQQQLLHKLYFIPVLRPRAPSVGAVAW